MNVSPVSAPTQQSGRRLSWKFSARDLINTAIFGAIFMVVTYAVGMLSLFGPLMWLVSFPIAIVINGITFMLFLTRVHHAGMITLFSVVIALFFILHGGMVIGAAAAVLLGLIVEVIAYAGGYRSRWAAIASYTVFGLAGFIPVLPMIINRDAYFGSPAWQSMGEAFVHAADELFTLPLMGAVAVGCVVAGFIGGLFGTAMLRKHFVNAGLA